MSIARQFTRPEAAEKALARAMPSQKPAKKPPPPSQSLPPLQTSAPRPPETRKPAPGKVRVGIRIDEDVLDAFKAQGKGWQSKINEALRKALGM